MITVALWFQDGRTSLNVCLAAIHMFSLFYYLLLPHVPTYTLIQFLFTCTLSSFMMTWINRQTIVSQPVILIDRWIGIKNISTSHTLLLFPPPHTHYILCCTKQENKQEFSWLRHCRSETPPAITTSIQNSKSASEILLSPN